MTAPAGILKGAAVITTATAPTLGNINRYNATSGSLSAALPALSGLNVGASCIVEKLSLDVSANTITFTAHSGDTFDDATTTLVLRYTGEKRALQVISVAAVKYWKITEVSPGTTAPGTVADNADGTVSVNAINALEPLSTTVIRTASTAPVIGQTTYYNATSGNLTPTLPALSGLRVGGRLAVRRDPADVSTNTVTVSRAGSDTFYSSGATSFTLPISGEQREFQVISVSGTKYWAPQGSVNPISGLDARYPVRSGSSTLDGCTIGGTGPTTASPSVNAVTLKNPTGGTVLSGSTQKPWLNQSGFFSGSLTGVGFFNQLIFNDTVVATDTLNGLQVTDAVFTPATGLRNGIFGKVLVFSAGTQPQASASYVGVAGRAEILGTLGGTIGTPMGAVWGLWGFGSVNGSTIHAQAMYGAELDVYVASGCTIDYKYGLAIVGVPGDSVRGSVDDILIEACVAPSSTTWKNGIMFGNNQGALAGNAHVTWPFASDSTIIGTCVADGALPANIGIDFSGVTFTDVAIKTGPAAIQMTGMASPPATPASGKGRLYIAADGSLHYVGPTTDTEIAPA